ncbi:hypothetical protein [Jiella pacifica]|uniref:Uncharacterized protein n=1 Tax=Jiella pacifica TaxID=2696469 RepID=A0A6N9SXX2_9HYPH|nr:hypothetical protein [Jiella pacifica]NDW03152.1 hypothetical protein [Jiella pacifica]
MPKVQYLSVKEVADRLKDAEATGRHLIKGGQQSAIDIGTGWRSGHGEPDGLASAVVWLKSDEPKFVTPVESVIDGSCKAMK